MQSPGLSFLANSASRTSRMICEDSDAERPGKKIRPGSFVAMTLDCVTMSEIYPSPLS